MLVVEGLLCIQVASSTPLLPVQQKVAARQPVFTGQSMAFERKKYSKQALGCLLEIFNPLFTAVAETSSHSVVVNSLLTEAFFLSVEGQKSFSTKCV